MLVVWRCIVENSKLEEMSKWIEIETFRLEIGNGKSILFCKDIWCGNRPLKVVFPRMFRLAIVNNIVVKDVARNKGFEEVYWRDVFLRKLLHREVSMLNNLKTLVGSFELDPGVEDRIIWIHDSAGEFIVRKLSQLLSYDGMGAIDVPFDEIWNLKVPPRVRNFLWMLVIKWLPTKDFLISRGVNLDTLSSGYPWCDREMESVNHLSLFANMLMDLVTKLQLVGS